MAASRATQFLQSGELFQSLNKQDPQFKSVYDFQELQHFSSMTHQELFT